MTALRRLWPVLLILVLLAATFATGLYRQLSWESLAAHQAALRRLVAMAPAVAAAAYVAAYAAAVALSIPFGVLFTVSGGLLFGTLVGGTLAVMGATIGAIVLFLVARNALAPLLTARAGPLLDRVRPGLQRDGFSYLLAMRLIPVVPFWLTNLAPALVGIPLAPYAGATFIGIMPATFVFASIGAGAGNVLAAYGRPDLSLIWSPLVLLPLVGLAALSLLPVAWRRWKARHG
jgi:uncharacterized membrane protein YdjX (TVP38/TMEM64 family)